MGMLSNVQNPFNHTVLNASLIYDIDISYFKKNLNLLIKKGIIIIYYIEVLYTKLKYYIKISTKILD